MIVLEVRSIFAAGHANAHGRRIPATPWLALLADVANDVAISAVVAVHDNVDAGAAAALDEFSVREDVAAVVPARAAVEDIVLKTVRIPTAITTDQAITAFGAASAAVLCVGDLVDARSLTADPEAFGNFAYVATRPTIASCYGQILTEAAAAGMAWCAGSATRTAIVWVATDVAAFALAAMPPIVDEGTDGSALPAVEPVDIGEFALPVAADPTGGAARARGAARAAVIGIRLQIDAFPTALVLIGLAPAADAITADAGEIAGARIVAAAAVRAAGLRVDAFAAALRRSVLALLLFLLLGLDLGEQPEPRAPAKRCQRGTEPAAAQRLTDMQGPPVELQAVHLVLLRADGGVPRPVFGDESRLIKAPGSRSP